MMYNNKLAMAIKVNGQVLRETGQSKDEVFLPFGSEYSILLKNLETVKAQVTVFIDGKDIADGTRFVLEPNSEVTLERFLPHGNSERGNRFKFIERNSQVEQHRGVKVDDGLIRIEYQFEQKVNNEYINRTHYYDDWKPRPNPYPIWPHYPNVIAQQFYNSVTSGGGTTSALNCNSSLNSFQASSTITSYIPELENDVGITAPGSISEQKFHNAYIGELNPTKHVMVIKLRGKKPESTMYVEQPVTVSTKVHCTMCNKAHKPGTRYCSGCGASLFLVD